MELPNRDLYNGTIFSPARVTKVGSDGLPCRTLKGSYRTLKGVARPFLGSTRHKLGSINSANSNLRQNRFVSRMDMNPAMRSSGFVVYTSRGMRERLSGPQKQGNFR